MSDKKIFDFRAFAREYGITIIESGDSHCTRGWVQAPCPFCKKQGYYLGFNIKVGIFNCWFCGRHTVPHTIKQYTKAIKAVCKAIEKRFTTKADATAAPQSRRVKTPLNLQLVFPKGCGNLKSQHKLYLINRNYDPFKLEQEWGLLGTGPMGPYSNRIIAPIQHEGQIVSYQGRDITNKHFLRYKACKKEDEVVYHKHTIYGADFTLGETIIIVEGLPDVWRLGYGAGSCYGTGLTKKQLRILSKYKRRFWMFDARDPLAEEQAEKYAQELSVYPGWDEIIRTDAPDPGLMDEDDAKHLMDELLRGEIISLGGVL